MHSHFHRIFPEHPPLIAMLHVPALPGTPMAALSIQQMVDVVVQEALQYTKLGVDALLLENMHDTPYLAREVGPEITACMTAVACAVKRVVPNLPMGVQVLAGANKSALAVALAAGLDFIRAEGFVFGHLADEGWMNSDAGELLRYRRHIGAEHIAIFTDIKKKHSAHAMSADVGLVDTAHAAQFFRTDGVIITGNATGNAPAPEDLQSVKAACPELPLLLGSGLNLQNMHDYTPFADGFIVGSALKQGGHWANPIDAAAVEAMVELLKKQR